MIIKRKVLLISKTFFFLLYNAIFSKKINEYISCIENALLAS